MNAECFQSKLKLTINGTPVEVEPGKSILEAAESKNIYIPTLCHHPELSRYGACRLCLVQVEGSKKLFASCTTPAADGLVVSTNTPRINRMRKTMIELLLLHHPLDCLTCDRGGDCELQRLTFKLMVTTDRFGYKKVKTSRPDTSNLIIWRDMSKCTLCGKCVRVCEEVRNIGAIGISGRGFSNVIGHPYNNPTDCEYCGQCLAICPVGAMSSVLSFMKARPWEITSTRSVCSYCGCGCNFLLDQKQGEVVRISTDEALGANHGLLCVKGRFGFDYLSSDQRLRSPLIRKEGRLVESTWKEALSLVAKTLMKIKKEKGAGAIGGIASGRCTNEENYLFQKLMRLAVGTNNIDNFTRYEHAPTLEVFSRSMGLFSGTSSIPQLQKSDLIVVIGSNPSHSHPIFAVNIKQAVRNQGAGLIVIDPQATELTRFADTWLRLKPGTDAAVLNALIGELVRQRQYDIDFVSNRTEGFEKLKATVLRYSAQQAAGDTQTKSEDIKEAARLIGGARAVSFVFGLGLTQHENGSDNVQALVNLALLTGNVGRPGAGLFPLRVNNNSQGCCDMGNLPEYLPGYQSVTSGEAGEIFAREWKVEVPQEKGLNATEMMEAARNKSLSALFVMGENLAVSFPGTKGVKNALDCLDFLVVSDLFLTETAQYAQVVFPATGFSEKDGTYTSLDRRVQRVRASVSPRRGCKSDREILCRIASRMGYKMHYDSPEEIFEEIRRVVPIYRGISYKRLEEDFVYKGVRYKRMEGNLGIQWPCPDDSHPGSDILGIDGLSGRARFIPVACQASNLEGDDEYPYLLLQGGSLFHHQSGAMSHKTRGLNTLEPDPDIKINPADAAKLGVSDGTLVCVRSQEGRITLAARISDRFLPGTVYAAKHFAGALPNSLFSGATVNDNGMPDMKRVRVAIEKVEEPRASLSDIKRSEEKAIKICCKEYEGIDLSLMDPVIEKYNKEKGALIPVLQQVQAIYGWLPEPVVERIAWDLRVHISEVYGVISFYSQFYSVPRGKHLVRLCRGTACHVNGSGLLEEKIRDILQLGPGEATTGDNLFTYEEVACLGCCGLAPVMTIGDSVHGKVKQDQLEVFIKNVE